MRTLLDMGESLPAPSGSVNHQDTGTNLQSQKRASQGRPDQSTV